MKFKERICDSIELKEQNVSELNEISIISIKRKPCDKMDKVLRETADTAEVVFGVKQNIKGYRTMQYQN